MLPSPSHSLHVSPRGSRRVVRSPPSQRSPQREWSGNTPRYHSRTALGFSPRAWRVTAGTASREHLRARSSQSPCPSPIGRDGSVTTVAAHFLALRTRREQEVHDVWSDSLHLDGGTERARKDSSSHRPSGARRQPMLFSDVRRRLRCCTQWQRRQSFLLLMRSEPRSSPLSRGCQENMR